MTRPSAPVPLASQLTLAGVATATTWVALLSWRGFVVDAWDYLGPALVLGVVVSGVGALARWWRVPALGVVAAQVIASGLVASTMLCGAPLPVGAARIRLVDAFTDAVHSANTYAPPVPVDAPSVVPLLIAGSLACLLLVDISALTLRRVPLAGLPLLVIYSVPISMIGRGPSWWVFALTAVGFLGLLHLHESQTVTRWGRQLVHPDRPGGADPQGFGVRTGAVRGSAAAIGSAVTVLALAVPIAVPTLSWHVLDFGAGAGGDDEIHLNNPMVSLQRNLTRGADVPLLTVRTDDPDPSYLRIAVLNQFDGSRWSAGQRSVPAANRAEGVMPALTGVSTTVPRQDYRYQVTADPDFESTWLPTTQNVSRIQAAGDWRYDTDDMDFAASDDDLTTARLTWTFTGVKLKLAADRIDSAGPSSGQVARVFTQLPSDLDPSVRNLALSVTRQASTPFARAVALQQWFRQGGGFVYDDTVKIGDSADDLTAFLAQGGNGRRGYCQQFAAAMAAMARTLNIPARVAVGFLTPDRSGRDTYVYSAHDMHAWPELYFSGVGWVRFEPTPAGRASTVPGYTSQQLDAPPVTLPSTNASASPDDPRRSDQTDKAREQTPTPTTDTGSDGSGAPWGRVLGGAALIVLLLALAAAPRILRRRRRDARREAGVEEAWAELRDTALDLGLAWPRARSPRETGAALMRYVGGHPDAVRALDRLVAALERLRYARPDGRVPGAWRAEVDSCVEALYADASPTARRWATWWPRSVFIRSTPVRVAEELAQPGREYAGAVDRTE